MPRVLIAPDSFKESLSAAEAAEAIARGVRAVAADAVIDLCPVADGGEGTVDALVAATRGTIRRARVCGPLGEAVEAMWGLLGDGATAVIEMAQAAGLALVPADRRNPANTTTYGVGELIRCALDAGASSIIIGIGGSATNDGGTGMAQALGVRFVGGDEPMSGAALGAVTAIDLSQRDQRLARTQIVAACDVTNPLTGPRGAAAVYGPQKGATAEQVQSLDAGLRHLASLMPDVDADAPGMGAAGGLGYGLVAFCGAELRRGIDLVLDAVGFDTRAAQADLVISGEGRLDGQSVQGKTCMGIAAAAARRGVPTIALVGSVGDGAELTLNHGLAAYHAICNETTGLQRAMREAGPLLEALTARVVGPYLIR